MPNYEIKSKYMYYSNILLMKIKGNLLKMTLFKAHYTCTVDLFPSRNVYLLHEAVNY